MQEKRSSRVEVKTMAQLQEQKTFNTLILSLTQTHRETLMQMMNKQIHVTVFSSQLQIPSSVSTPSLPAQVLHSGLLTRRIIAPLVTWDQ